MKRLIAIILLLIPVIGIAETVSITVSGPSQQLNVTKQSVIVQPQSVTENVIIDSTGTAVVTVAVPGPQGIPGTGTGGGGGTWGTITGDIDDQADLKTRFDNLTAHQHTPTTYNPATMAVQNGTLDAGTVANLSAIGGTLVSIAEATGSPALRVQLTYTGVAAVNNVVLYGRYQGGAGHEVAVQVWNVATSAWDTLGRMATSTVNQWYSYPLINGADYLNAGTVLVRLEHLQNGIASHDLYLDYAVIRHSSDATGGGVTDHGALTGLTGHDDHTQYALADGSRGALPAGSVTGLAAVATTGSYADLSGQPTIPSAASDISYTNPTYPTVAAALDTLLYQPITITSYTLDGGSSITREIGSSYTVSTLAWSTSKTPTTETINSVARTSPYAINSTITSTTTYTLYVADGALSNASSSRSVTFTHYRYWGVSSLDTLTDSDIIALSKEFSTSRSKSTSYTATGQYLYFCYLATGGDATFTVNGFLDTSWVLVQREFVNASTYPAEFRIYRSANPLTGTYTVVVS